MTITRIVTATFPDDRRPSPRRALAVLAAVAGTAVLAAGCGSQGPTPTVGQTHQNFASTAFKYSSCMRAHGVSNFPDPVVHSSPDGTSVTERITPGISGSPAFQTASHACQGILPAPTGVGSGETPEQQHQKLQDELAFVRCLRSHGLSNFPDPNAQGQLSPGTLSAAGVDLQSPAFATAGKACLSASGGLITPAELQQVESGGGTGHQSGSAGQ